MVVKMEKGKNKKVLVIVLLILFITAGAGACCLYLTRVQAADENQELVLEEGQEYAYAKIIFISGNEMEYIILEAQKADYNGGQEKGASEKGRSFGGAQAQDGKMSSKGETPDNMENMPSGGGFPDMGNMPSGGGMPRGDDIEGDERPGVQKSPARDGAGNIQNADVMTYIETDETGQMQIPVGTEVETKLGTVTTFSRLSNGDIIKMLLQEDDTGTKALIKIWIME